MPVVQQEVLATYAPDGTDRVRRLADRLSVMLPGATRIRINATDMLTFRSRLTADAYDGADRPVRLSGTQAMTAARWVIRTHPQTNWIRPHTFDLRTARLDADGGR
ncbi:transcriptional regulator [Streptomyces olivoreticuli]